MELWTIERLVGVLRSSTGGDGEVELSSEADVGNVQAETRRTSTIGKGEKRVREREKAVETRGKATRERRSGRARDRRNVYVPVAMIR